MKKGPTRTYTRSIAHSAYLPVGDSPLAGTLTDEQLLDKLAKTKETKMQPMAKMPSHDEFLEMFGKVS